MKLAAISTDNTDVSNMKHDKCDHYIGKYGLAANDLHVL
jgi:hypothetical protein